MIPAHSGKADFIVFIFILMIYLYSCKDEEVVVADQSVDFSFFPLKTGHWVEYEVDSVVHYNTDDAGQVDTAIGAYHFYLREEVDTSFIDGENQLAFVVKKFRRDCDTLPWALLEVGTAKVTPLSAQEVENNIRFIRLAFPINSSAEWNGNAYNFFAKEDYHYENLFEPLQIGALSFDSTVTVIQNEFVSQINRVDKKEIYGSEVGLLFKQSDSVRTRITVNGTIILNGLEYKCNIIDYNH